MAWTTPPTFTDGNILTGAQLNLIRDDLNETAPAKATQAGEIFVATGANSIAARRPTTNGVSALQSIGSTSYVDLSTPGPAVTVTTGARAIVVVTTDLRNTTLGQSSWAGYAVTGGTPVAASDDSAVKFQAWGANAQAAGDRISFQLSLSPGSNTFTMKYRVDGGSGSWENRRIVVIPL